MLDKILNELIPRQTEEIKKAVRDGIPIMIVDNTGSGCEVREKLRCELKANNAILIPDTVAEFREYNTAYLRIELNIEGGEGVNISDEEMALISKDVVNLLAEKGCTVAEACEILRKTERCIGATADVKKLNW